MNDLIDTTEMYLRTIFELEEEGIVPLRARIAERLHQSGPTVSQTVARMERDGLLTVEGDRHLQLSDEGRALATAVMRKHRLAECLLVDVIGLDYADVHEEACRWEHVMSEAVERKLLEPARQPDGLPVRQPDPRPGGAARRRAARRRRPPSAADALTLLSTDRHRRGAAGRDPADQRAAAGERRPAAGLADQGVRPGASMVARLVDGSVQPRRPPLPAGVAQHLFVTAADDDRSRPPLEAADRC